MVNSLTDEEYVVRMRRHAALHDRWRPWLVGLYGTLVVAWVGLLAAALYLVNALGQLGGARGPIVGGFVVGTLLGAIVGLNLIHVAHGLVNSLKSGRTERLLLRYHDALADFARVSSSSAGRSESAILPRSPFDSHTLVTPHSLAGAD
jgi:hypothetical protein